MRIINSTPFGKSRTLLKSNTLSGPAPNTIGDRQNFKDRISLKTLKARLYLFALSFLLSIGGLNAQSCSCSGNLVTNGNFESGTTGWNWSGGNFGTGNNGAVCPSSSGNAGQFQITNSSNNWATNTFASGTISPGEVLDVKVWAGTHDPSFNHYVSISYFDSNWNYISGDSEHVNALLPNSQQYNIISTVPSNAHYIQVGQSGTGSWIKTDGWCVTTTDSGLEVPPAPTCGSGDFIWDNNISVSGCTVNADWGQGPCCNWTYTIPGPYPSGMTSGPVSINIGDAVAWDGYCGRSNTGNQTGESYKVIFKKNGVTIWESPLTGNSSSNDGVATGTESAFWRGPLGGTFLPNGTDEIILRGGANSVYPSSVCISYDDCTPAPTPQNWTVGCDDGQIVDVYGNGAGSCANTPDIEVTIPSSGNTFSTVVEVAYKGNDPGNTITVYDQSNNVYCLDKTTSTSWNGYVYSGELPGNISKVSHEAVTYSGGCGSNWGLQSMVVYAFRNTSTGTAQSGVYSDASGYNNVRTFSIPVQAGASPLPRDLTVRLPITELTNDGRYMTVRATANGVTNSTTIYGPDVSLNTCCLNIIEVELPNVPSNATNVDIEVITVNGALQGSSLNGQSWIMAGFITIDQECLECAVTASTSASPGQICSGASSTISATGANGTSPYSYAWNNGLGSGATKTVNPTSTTVYRVTVTDAAGCTKVATRTVTVNPKPTLDAGVDAEICNGQSVTLTTNAVGGTAPYSYAWSNGLGAGSSKTVSPTTTTTYVITVTDSKGCSDTDNVKVTVAHNVTNPGTITGNQTICGGYDPSNIGSTGAATGGSGSPIKYFWQKRDQPCGGAYTAWSNIAGATAGGYNPPAITKTTQYRRVAYRELCYPGFVISNVITKEVVVNFDNAGTIGNNESQCNAYNPANIVSLTDPTGGCGTAAYLWQTRELPCGGSYTAWSNIANSNAKTYNPGNITTTTQYRRLSRRGVCSWVYSAVVTKEVVEQFDDAGTIAGDQSLCGGYDPSNITNATSPTGGCGGTTVYLWQTRSQPCNGTYTSWTNIASSNTLTYNPGAITSTSQYRRLSKRANGCTPGWVYSNVITKEVVEQYDNGGTIAANESLCGGYNPANITNVAGPTGGCGGTPYSVWQKREKPCGDTDYGAWATITGANALAYNPGAITISTQYRRLSRRAAGCSPGWGYSNVVTKEVTEQYTDPGVIAGDEEKCSAYDPANITNATSPSGGCGGDPFYVWQKAEYDCSGAGSYSAWANIADSDALTYNPSQISVTTKYRRVARRDDGCTPVWVISNEVVKTVVENFTTGGTIAAPEEKCGEYNPALITSTTLPDGDNCFGTVQYRWQTSEKDCDAGTWSPSQTVAGATSTTYNPGVITGTSRYRRQVRKLPCTTWNNSNWLIKTVVINYDDPGTIQANQEFCVEGDPEMLTGTDPSGGCTDGADTYQWQKREFISGAYTAWANIGGATASTYDPSEVSVTTQFRRRVKKGTCPFITSNNVTITVKDNPVSGIDGPSTICAKEMVTFSADPVVAGATYAWTFQDGTPATSSTPSVNVEWMTVGVKAIELTVTKDGCSVTYDAAINITQEVQAVAGPDLEICKGGSVTIDGGGTPGGNYTWTVESGDPTSIDNGSSSDDVTVSPAVTTTYRLTVSQNGCTRADFITVVIDVNKNPVADAGDDSAECIGEDFTIGGAPTGTPPVDDPTAELGYVWSPASLLNDETIANPTANIDVAGDQTFQVIVYSFETGCSDTSSVTITIEEKAKVGNYIWMDSNYDGIQDAGEMGLNGIKVDLLDPDFNIVETTTTSTIGGQAGSYEFEVCKGQYRIDVAETEVDNKIVTLRDVGSNATDSDINANGRTTLFTLQPGDNDPTWDAGFAGVIDLSLVKTVNDNTPNVGDVVTYTITVANDGPNDATGVSVEDIIPNGLSGITNISNGGSMTAGVINWTGLTLADGASMTLTYDATVEAPGAGVSYVNVAQVTSDDQFDIDSTPDNDDGDQSEDDEDPEEITPQEADLNLVKVVNTATPNVGDVVTFTITVTNDGPDAATGVRVRDGLPNGYTNITNISAPGLLNGPGTAINWSGQTIASGASATFTFDAEVLAPGAGVNYDNIARVQLSDQYDSDSTPGNAADTDGDGNIGSQDPDDDQDPDDEDDGDNADVLPQQIDLELEKVASDNEPNVGDVITYTITIENKGPDDATGVSVEDIIPNGLSGVTNISNGGSMTAGVINWSGLSIADGGSVTLTYDATVEAPEAGVSYVNVAQVTGADQFDIDSTPDNDDGDQSEDDEDPEEVTPQVADLNLVKVVNTATPNVGDVVTFTITVTNDGPDAATGVRVRDGLPNGYTNITNISAPGLLNGPGTAINWSGQTIASGASATFTFDAEVLAPGAGVNYDNIARVQLSDQYDSDSTPGNAADTDGDGNIGSQDPDDDQDPDDEDDGDNADVLPQQIDLELEKVASDNEPNVGDVITYTISIENKGPDDATGVSVEDIIPNGLSGVTNISNGGSMTAGVINWSGLSIADGGSVTLTYDAVVEAPGTGVDYENVAQVTGADQFDIDSTPDNDDGDQSEDDEDPEVIVPQQIDLELEKVVSDNEPNVGDVVTYTITIDNKGPDDATSVSVEDIIPNGLSGVTNISNGGSMTAGVINWTGLSIANGGSVTLTYDAVVEAPVAGVSYVNVAQVTGADQFDIDSTPDNDDGDQSEDDEDAEEITPQVADLNLVKIVNDATPSVGDVVTFTITVTNEGPDAATGVRVRDGLPNGYTNITNISAPGLLNGPATAINWSNQTIASGATATFTFDAEVLAPGANTNYNNIARIQLSDQYDSDSTPGNPADTDGDGDIGSQDPDDDQDPDDEDDGDNAYVVPSGTITGYVTEDTDNDDVGNDPIEGVIITLTNNDTGAILTTTTDENGYYEFLDLDAGSYTVTEQDETELDEDFVDVFDGDESDDGDVNDLVLNQDDSIDVTLEIGEDDEDNNFVEEQLGTICGNVSEDTDNDDVANVGISGVTITLTDVDANTTVTALTDGNGDYCFEGLEPGEYTITEQDETEIDEDFVDVFDGDETSDDADDAVDALDDDSIEVTLVPGEDDLDNNFVEEQLGTICGNVSEDTDNDDVANVGISGVTITLTDVDANTTVTALTDGNGDYCFEGLEPGEYTITEQDETEIDEDFVDVFDGDETSDDADDAVDALDDDSIEVTLVPGEDDLDNNFVEEQLGTICGNVSEDTDNDDVANVGISGVTITLTDVDANTTVTALTDGNGDYCFEGLEPGEYTITEQDETEIDEDFVDVFDGDETSDDADDAVDALDDDSIEVTLVPGEDDLDNNFVEEQLGTICGNVSEDTDNDDVANVGISGVTITLTDVDANTTVTALTDGNGDYCFEGLEPGEYTITEQDETEIDEDFVDVFDGDETSDDADDAVDALDDDSIEVTLVPGEDDLDNNFVEEQLGTICGNVSEDTDNDDVANVGISGVTITLTDVDANTTVTALTDGNGDYCFEGLEPGEYTITEQDETEIDEDFVDVFDGDETSDDADDAVDALDDDSIEVTLVPGEDDLDNNFVEEQLGTICGNVSEDTDNDDVANVGISGVTITLTDVDANTTVTALTDGNGDYCFEGLEPGEYTITEQDETEIDEDFVDVFDGDETSDDADDAVDALDDDSIEVTLVPGEDDLDNNFVEEQLGTICGNVSEDTDNDDVANVGISGVTITLTDIDANTTVTALTDGNGDYCFEGLEPGEYTITEQDETEIDEDFVDVFDGDETSDDADDAVDALDDDSIEVTLVPGEDDLDNNFVEEQLGTICGNVSEDTDNDDVANVGISGVTITLTDVDANTTVTALTDGNGDYCFEGLEPGEYTITEQDETEIDEDFVDVFDGDETSDDADDAVDALDDDSIEVTLVPGEDDLDNNFVEEQLGTICGNVSEDTDNDDVANVGISGVTITLTDVDANTTVTALTDGNGDYCFEGLEPGEYTITEQDETEIDEDFVDVFDGDETSDDADDAVDALDDDSIEVTLVPGEDDLDNNFVEEQLGTICGNVSEDTDNDDVANVGISGVTITLTDVDANTTVTALTDGNGDYCFEGLEPGEYTITEQDETEIDEDFVDVFDGDETSDDADDAVDALDDDSIEVTLVPGEDDLDNNFLEEQLGTICGNVSEDTDNDDVANVGISGVTITLTDVDANTTVTALTDGNGDYCFEGLEPGEYTITEQDETEIDEDFVDVFDGDETSDDADDAVDALDDDSIEVTLVPGEDDLDNNFLEEQLGTICGNVSEDTDNDDVANVGISGVTITLTDVDANTTVTALTDGNGDYCFEGLEPGEYTITEQDETEIDEDFVDVFDGDETSDDADDAVDALDDDSIEVTLVPGEDDLDNNFVEEQLGTISGTVELDTDNDDIGDTPQEDVTVTLLDSDGNVVATTMTDENGDYIFEDVEPGDYTVVVEDPANSQSVSDEDNTDDGDADDMDDTVDNTVPVTLEPGEDDTSNDFVDEELGTISGNVSEDTDNDDIGDLPIEDVTITLLDENGVVVQTTMTDENGDYTFTGVEPGDYTVVEQDETELDEDFVDVFDGDETSDDANDAVDALDDDIINVTLNAGEDDEDNNFVEEQLGSISGTVELDTDNDDIGDTPQEDVTVTLLDSDGNVVATTMTDENGDYIFEDVEPGDYTVVVEDPANSQSVSDEDESDDGDADDMDDTVDNTVPVTVDPGEDDDSNNFVDEELGTISGNVSEDTDNDDIGDSPIEDVTITLLDENGVVVQTTMTDENGDYTFTGVEPGDYTVVEQDETELDEDFVDVFDGDETSDDANDAVDALDDDIINVTLNAGEDDEDNNFVEEQLGSISGTVELDTDNDDIGDTPQEDVTVTLLDSDGNVVATTMTDENGDYIFEDVEPGDYTVVVEDPANSQSVSDEDESDDGDADDMDDTVDNTVPVTVDPGEDDDSNNFVDEELGTISGNVSEDTDNDDIGDSPIEDVTITLLDENGVVVQTTMTDENGDYTFTGVEPGDYTVVEQDETELDEDFVDVFDGDETSDDANDAVDALDDDIINVTLNAGEDDEDNNFVEEQLGSISGTVELDTDNDDIGDTPQEDVTVTLLDSDGNVVATTMTDENGDYIFEDVEPGDYTVVVEDPANSQSVSDEDNTDDGDADDMDDTVDNTVPVTLEPGEDDTSNDFVDEELGTISGNVSEDTDNDDIGDSPIEDVTITLLDENGVVVQTTMTDENGDYTFTGVEPGDYTVVEQDETELDEDFVDVFDGDETSDDANDAVDALDDDIINVTLNAGEDDEDNNFVEEQLGSISGTVELDTDNDDIGDTPQEDVTVTLLDSDGNVVATTMTDENGDYIFEDVEPGDYTVVVEDPANSQSVSDEDESDDGDADDMDDTVDNTVPVTVDPGEDDDSNNFVDEELGTISGNVSEDTDNDDIGDSPIEDVTITLLDENGVVVQTTMTDENGDYTFTGVEPGNYTVVEQDETELDEDFVDVFDGDETSDDANDAVDALDDDIINVTLNAGEDDEDNNFVEEQLGTISGNVSLDDDNDDVADTPQEDVTVTLLDSDGNVVATTMTDENGDYEFTDLEPGDYTVTVGTPTGAVSVSDEDEDPDGDASDTDMTVDDSVTVTLTPGEDDVENNFIDELTASLGNFVWFDENGNGLQDADEDGVNDVRVELYSADDLTTVVAFEMTAPKDGEDGYYLFENIAPGSYVVKFITPSETVLTTQDVTGLNTDATDDNNDSDADATTGFSHVVELSAGEEDLRIDAGIYEQLSLGNFVWDDVNNNGMFDTGEAPISGVTISLFRDLNNDNTPDGASIRTAVTDGSGNYLFDELAPGDYIVVVDPSNFINGNIADYISSTGNDLVDGTAPDADNVTSDTDDNGYDNGGNIGIISKTVTLSSREEPTAEDGDNNTNLTVDFGFFKPAAIGDYVWNDTNADGIQDNTEEGINDVRVTLRDGVTDAVIATMLTMSNPVNTDEQGYYLFDNLVPGSYYVEFETPEGFSTTIPGATSDERDSDVNDAGNMGVGMSPIYTLNAGDRNLNVDAGYYQSAKVGNYVWLDVNGSMTNTQDAGDAGVNDITVNLIDLVTGQVVATQVTRTEDGNDGYYMFTDLPAGDYLIQFDIPEAYSFVIPNQGADDIDSDVIDLVNMTTSPFTLAPGACIEDIDAGLAFNVLPVELSKFAAKYNDTKDVIDLDWETQTEINSDRFEIERRHESESSFYYVGEQKAEGNSLSRVNYDFIDTEIDRAGDYFYRLKMIDIDGAFEYSEIRVATVERGVIVSTSIYPNPASRFINVDVEVGARATVKATLLTDAGRLVRSNAINETVEAGINKLNVDLDGVTGGAYLLRVEIGSEVSFHKILVIK